MFPSSEALRAIIDFQIVRLVDSANVCVGETNESLHSEFSETAFFDAEIVCKLSAVIYVPIANRLRRIARQGLRHFARKRCALGLKEIQTSVLDDDSVLLEYALGAEKSFLWIVSKNDFAASKTAAMSPVLADFQYIHFAAHGFVNNENPELSGIVFSMIDASGKEQDGFLRIGDIYNLKLPAEMVVLSGCRTGLGKEIKGEGLVGLTRGLMYAGAKRVTVSLWDVNDEATSVLMANFYREMFGEKKLSPANGLRQSQISMIKSKDWNNPYFWSTFVLQGEPQ